MKFGNAARCNNIVFVSYFQGKRGVMKIVGETS